MNRQDVERTITEYLKPIFGFALKRCKSLHDAEDLSQEIATRAFRALLVRDDVADMGKFIWTVAHNTLSNYYRDAAKSIVGISIDEAAELIADPCSEMEADNTEAIHRLQTEIAYLSKLQRKIVIAYYFENRRQADIAKELGIPLGTVKWHLFEAKKELKRGMDTMRKESELKFHPIKFHSYGINGSSGTRSLDEFLGSTLSQNICYCVRNTAKSINEIAEALGVSPVYVESEVEFLEEYGYRIPYIAAWSGEKLMDDSISFKEVATIRPDGAYNICHASVVPDEIVLPEDYVYKKNWCGPMLHKGDESMMWQIDTEWSDRVSAWERNVPEEMVRTVMLYNWEKDNLLSKQDYAWLAERGYIKTGGDYDGRFKSAWQIVILDNKDIQDRLLAIGERIKEKYRNEFDALKKPYTEAVLQSVPTHLRKIKEYELQFLFYSDGWFLLHCITVLLKNGKLKEPTEGQKKSLTTLIVKV